MNSDLELLLQLQVIDYDIGELERSKEYLPDMIENLTREVADCKEKFDAAKLQLDETRSRQKQVELEIASHEASLQKYQQQMMSIKTNKEYDALVSEIDAIKNNISTHETELLQAIERSDGLEKQIEELNARREQIEENNDKQLKILREKIATIGEKMTDKESSRNQIISSIPRPTLSAYERVRRGRGGQAVVAVKKRACGSCFKALTPKKVQDVKRGDRIFTCDHCGALMYWNEEVSA
jgi:hypothetical protein